MNVLAVLFQRITKAGIFLGGLSLIAGMLLLISNIFGRFVHFIIPGTYEMFELIMAIPVAFAVVYAALQSAHVSVDLIVSRFPPKLRAAAEILSYGVSFLIWALMAYAGAELAFENGLNEISETLEIPYLPFRMVWIFSLCLFCLVYLLDLYRAIRRFLDK
jgi:TRAP-type C4-dicarboxylate transport system permease small subunit